PDVARESGNRHKLRGFVFYRPFTTSMLHS
ncbi:unnamed protein product, partial [marine sediment metagenome]